MPTPSQTIGPFFGFALPYDGGAELVAPDQPGAVRIEGAVLDGAGEPVTDALVELWQAGGDGGYHDGLFGRCPTDAHGEFAFVTVKPGRVGAQAPHINVTVFARGLLKRLVTRIYFPDEVEANAADPVLALLADRAALIADGSGGALRYDVHLQGERETVFFGF
jgi:protocatechuate 3,4-dioxygenase alpha subunit